MCKGHDWQHERAANTWLPVAGKASHIAGHTHDGEKQTVPRQGKTHTHTHSLTAWQVNNSAKCQQEHSPSNPVTATADTSFLRTGD